MENIPEDPCEAQAQQDASPQFPSGFPIGKKAMRIAPGSEAAYDEYVETWRQQIEQNWDRGYTQMPDEIRHDPTLSPRAKIVYEALLSFMWCKTDRCWPSQKTLAKCTGYSVRTVIRALNDLYERGYIEVWRRGQGDTNYYFINPLTFVKSFRTVGRGRGVRLQVRSLHQVTMENTPAPDVLSGLCQVVSFRSDNLADQEMSRWQTNQTNPKQTHLNSMSSNHSTIPSEGRGAAIGKANAEPAAGTPRSARTEETNRSGHTTSQSNPNPAETLAYKTGAARAKAAKLAELAKQGTPVGGAEQIALATGIPVEHLEALGVAPERKRRPIPDFIQRVIADFSAELGDNPRSHKSSVTRATKIFYTALAIFTDFREDPEGHFLRAMYEARRATGQVTNIRHHTGARINRMPVFFACLENQFGFHPDELEWLRSDAPLYYPEQAS